MVSNQEKRNTHASGGASSLELEAPLNLNGGGSFADFVGSSIMPVCPRGAHITRSGKTSPELWNTTSEGNRATLDGISRTVLECELMRITFDMLPQGIH